MNQQSAKTRIYYLCDPGKNTGCKKNSCMRNAAATHPVCDRTTKREVALQIRRRSESSLVCMEQAPCDFLLQHTTHGNEQPSEQKGETAMAEKLLRPAQVAEALGVSPSTALRLMAGMPRVNLSVSQTSSKPRYAVRESDLERWKLARTQAPEQAQAPQRRGRKPSSMADMEKYCTRDKDGNWRIKRRA